MFPPSEIIYDPSAIKPSLLKIIKTSQWNPQLNIFNHNNGSAWKDEDILNKIETELMKAKLLDTLNGYRVMRSQMKDAIDSASLAAMLNYL